MLCQTEHVAERHSEPQPARINTVDALGGFVKRYLTMGGGSMRNRILATWAMSLAVLFTAPLALEANAAMDDPTYCNGIDGVDQQCTETLKEWCEDHAPHEDCCFKEGSRICFVYVHCSYAKLADIPGDPPPTSCGNVQ